MTDQIQRPTCAVKGSLHGGRAMFGRVTNAEFAAIVIGSIEVFK